MMENTKKYLLIVEYEKFGDVGAMPWREPFDSIDLAVAMAKGIHEEHYDGDWGLSFRIWEISSEGVVPVRTFGYGDAGEVQDYFIDANYTALEALNSDEDSQATDFAYGVGDLD